MVTKSKLRMALAAEKGVDFKKLKQKKKEKAALKKKAAKTGGATENESESEDNEMKDEEASEEEEDEEEDDEEEARQLDLDALNESDSSESELELEEKIDRRKPKTKATPKADDDEDDEEEEEDDEDDEDIPMSDLEDLDAEEREDIIPHTRLTINNTTALLASLNRIALPTDKSAPFALHQSITATTETASAVPDVSDDLQRELSFYSQSLEAVRQGRAKLRAEGVPFSRPKDYFAEMVKEDAHMEKVKAKLVQEASNKKAAAEARKLRDLKKFGKKVQVAKLQERQKEKRETLEKIKTLKRKRQEHGSGEATTEADLFDVGVEKELSKHTSRSGSGRGQIGGPNTKRQKKNEKYGFGGKKRHAKSGDAMSAGDLSGFDPKRMKAGGKGRVSKATRPGKNRRKAISSR